MGNVDGYRVVLGSLRFKSAVNTDFSFKVPFKQTQKLFTEYDRSIDVNLNQVFSDERQKSNIFKPSCKFSVIFKNTLAGSTNYVPFEDNLYYVNAQQAAINQCLTNSDAVSWSGYPQYNEFDFIRNDYSVPGYTTPPDEHVFFIPKSASTYNWNFFLSYAYENDYDKMLEAIDKKTNTTLTWKVSDGIPFIIENTTFNGIDVISFRCPVKHGVNVGEFVKLTFDGFPSYTGNTIEDTFQVDYLGVETYGSDEYVFNIIDVGYTGATFNNGRTGTAKRIISNRRPSTGVTFDNDTMSEYYVRKHKIMTNVDDAVLVKAGFEENIFGTKKKYESSGFTPNKYARVSIKEGSQSYSLAFNKDINITDILDNRGRPLSELFFTVVWKGYFGWMFKNIQGGGMKQGWEFNLPLKSNGRPNDWWRRTNFNADTNIPINTYTTSSGSGLGPGNASLEFCYLDSFKKNDDLDGDVCEWNNYDQTERVISKIYHKLKFNNFAFSTENIAVNNENPFGYYYQPHHKLTIRVFSDYIEEIDNIVSDIPNYAYYSRIRNSFRWRDLYTYGFVDTSGLGVDYPFLNNSHYPFGNYIFRIIPEGTNYVEQTLIDDPITDNCE
jgi:hypothetical protein